MDAGSQQLALLHSLLVEPVSTVQEMRTLLITLGSHLSSCRTDLVMIKLETKIALRRVCSKMMRT